MTTHSERVARYVSCPVTVTSPAPSPEAQALGLTANMACGEHCKVHRAAWTMEFRCPRGHTFVASWEDIEPPLRIPPSNPADQERRNPPW